MKVLMGLVALMCSVASRLRGRLGMCWNSNDEGACSQQPHLFTGGAHLPVAAIVNVRGKGNQAGCDSKLKPRASIPASLISSLIPSVEVATSCAEPALFFFLVVFMLRLDRPDRTTSLLIDMTSIVLPVVTFCRLICYDGVCFILSHVTSYHVT